MQDLVRTEQSTGILSRRIARAEEVYQTAQRYVAIEMSPTHYEDGAHLRMIIKDEMDINKTARQEITLPLYRHIRNMEARFKPSDERLQAALDLVDSKRIPWAEADAKRKGLDRPMSIATDRGTDTTMRIMDFEILDPDKVPDKYKTVDPVKIRRAVNDGVRRIPGVKVFQRLVAVTR